MAQRVVILGGGVAGMSAAHELIDRGFEVEVLEMRDIPGGKARSMPVPGSGTEGRPDLPGEHGFRFFPGFYKHLPDTMSRIPCPPACPRGHRVSDHLVGATQMQFARRGAEPVKFSFDAPLARVTSPFTGLRFMYEYRAKLNVPEVPFGYFMLKLLELMLRRDEWFDEFEQRSWLDYSGANGRYRDNRIYNRYLARGVTRSMVAARADEISARTAGCTVVKLFESLSRAAGKMDRVLDAPTCDAWIYPWLDYLRSKGVVYRTQAPVSRIYCRNGRISGVTVGSPNGERVKGDFYIAALPVEVMRAPIVTEAVREADPALGKLHRLKTRWMNGVQIYLRDDIPQIRGHTIYADTPWALTSISQRQFWKNGLAGMGDGRVRGVISVDVSDWKHGDLNGKPAYRSSRREVTEGVIEQLRATLRHDPEQHIDDSNVWGCFVDPAITYPNPSQTVNAEPLLINTPGSWRFRPEAETQIENLFLAADYVRTNTDLATMEGANEAARRAVNGILKQCGRDDLCEIWEWRPPVFTQAGGVVSLLGRIRRHVPFFEKRPVEPIPSDDLEELLLPARPATRAADRMLLHAAGKLGDDDIWGSKEGEELARFSRELVQSPGDAHEAIEHELDHPRGEVLDELRRD
jgi:uncharacterized protein with NAD-binding domain and iron-sulfur cluster